VRATALTKLDGTENSVFTAAQIDTSVLFGVSYQSIILFILSFFICIRPQRSKNQTKINKHKNTETAQLNLKKMTKYADYKG